MLSLKEYFRDPKKISISLLTHIGGVFSDKNYLSLMYYIKMGEKMNWESPQSFNQKLQWLKVFDRNPEYTKMVDKYTVKPWVCSVIGDEYVIPTLGVWNSPKDIEWDKLPNRFVLKATNGGGNYGVIICKDKNSLAKDDIINKLENALKLDLYKISREWPYKDVPRRIIAEQYLEDSKTKELRDYKFFCFNGDVKAMFVATERQKTGEDVKFDFFGSNYEHLPLRQGHENASITPEKPPSFVKMKELASLLSKGIPHVRVDFYEVDGHPYFGEMTFYHFGGMVPFEPRRWDDEFGGWLKLPQMKRK